MLTIKRKRNLPDSTADDHKVSPLDVEVDVPQSERSDILLPLIFFLLTSSLFLRRLLDLLLLVLLRRSSLLLLRSLRGSIRLLVRLPLEISMSRDSVRCVRADGDRIVNLGRC
jgi:hypothetical protein